jgi:hypothetical protein
MNRLGLEFAPQGIQGNHWCAVQRVTRPFAKKNNLSETKIEVSGVKLEINLMLGSSILLKNKNLTIKFYFVETRLKIT